MKTKGIFVIFALCWSALCGAAFGQIPPANDNFANAIVLTGASGSSNGDNFSATLEGLERAPFADPTNDNTVWYRWTAPQTGDATFDLSGAAFDTVMSIYTGNVLATLVLVDENDDGLVDTGSTVTFPATNGVTYSIQIAGLGGSGAGAEGTFPISWLIVNPAGTFRFSAATASVNEPDGMITLQVDRVGGSTGDVSVTFNTTPGTAEDGNDFTGATGPLNFLDGETTMTIDIPIIDDPDFEVPETFTVSLSGATGGSDIGPPSVATVTILSDELPANDNFANAEVIAGASGNVGGNDASATSEGGVEDSTLGPVVWYKWVAPSDGAVAFSLTSAFGHFVEILRGPGFPALQFVSEGALRKTAAVSIVAGTTYYIAVGGAGNAFNLAWQTTTTGVFELAGFRDYFDPLTGNTVPRYVAGENGGNVTITIRRVGALSGTVSVNCLANPDAADEFGFQNADAGDFTATGANVVFSPGESVKTVTVPILNDATVEPTEDLVVSLTTPTAGAVLGNVSRVQLQLFDDENDPANDDLASAQSIFGPAGQVFGDNTQADPEPTEPPFADGAAGNTIWYRWVAPLSGTTEFSATVDDGFGGVDAVVDVFASGVTGLTPVASSATTERFTAVSGQTYLVRVDSSAGIGVFGQTLLEWSIATGGVISFTTDSLVVSETGADVTATVTVQRVGGIENGATVDVVSSDVSATADLPGAPDDYAPVAQTLVFDPGQTSKTVNLTVHGDALSEGTEFFNVALQNPTGALLDAPANLTVSILDDDDNPANDAFAGRIVLGAAPGTQPGTGVGAGSETGEPAHGAFSVWSEWAAPGAGLATFSLNGTSSMFSPTVTIYTGTTLAGLTRVAQGFDGVNFIAAAATTYIVAITDDSTFSADGTAFTLDYSFDANGSLVSIASTAVSVAENVAGGNLVLTLTRTGSTAGTSTVDFTMLANTAVAPGDYTTNTGTVTFNATDVMQTITIPINNDMVVEGDEDFTVQLSNATGAVLSPSATTDIGVTILDDDDNPAPPANDNFASAATLAGNNAVVGGFSDGATTEVGEPGSPSQSVWYQWTATGNGVAMVSIGDAGHSFNVFTGAALGSLAPVSYLTGTTFATATGTTYFVQVNAAPGAGANFVLGLNFTGAGLLSFSSGGLVVNEDGGPATITILRTNGSTGAIAVRFRTAGITATSGADFTAVDTLVNFANGVTSQTVNVTILNDMLVEGEEALRLLLSDATGGAAITYGQFDVVALTINDDEDDPTNDDFANAIALSGPFGTTGGENVGASRQAGEPVHAGAATGASLWFRWTAPATGTVTFDTTGSAVATVLAGYTGAVVDALTELDSDAANPSVISFAATGGASYAIAVDSSGAAQGDLVLNWNLVLPGVLGFSPSSYAGAEGAANVVLTVARAIGADGAVSVHFATADGTATAGQDYTATSGDLDFADGVTTRTITVPLLNDTAFEVGESFTVVLSAPTNGASLGTTMATVTLTSNDPFTPAAVNFAALVNPGGTHATAGLLTLTESATASFTGKLLLGGKSYPMKGSFDAFGSAVITITRKGLSTLAIAMQIDDGGVTLAGRVYDGSFDSAFTGEASFYDGKTRLYPQPGPFTLALLPTSAAAGIPQGFGTATMTVGANGVFTIKGGQLGDSTSLSATGFIAQSGQAQFYSLLYKSQGSLAGVVNFRNQMTTDADGTLRWFKPANAPKQKFFLAGFDTMLNLNASFFTKPAPNTRIDTAFDAGNGDTDITLRDGNLAAPLAFSGLLDTANKFAATAPVPLTLAGNSKTGQFTGSFTPLGGKKTPFKGVFLQKSDQALGQFFGVSQGGGVTVVPD